MPELNWGRFEALPGDRRANFELLWRGAVRLNFGRYGRFQARAQQPGVEFHLQIERDCPLGDAGSWFGWQTKWWENPAGNVIGSQRRKDVEDSQKKTETHLPGLTDWVLCTRRPLTPTDQQWFDGLTPGFKLDHQVAEDLANLLGGDAALLRETYFGDLVLTPDRLNEIQESAVAEVRDRWFPEVHQSTDTEKTLRRMLADPEQWSDLDTVGTEISTLIEIIERGIAATPLSAGLQTELDSLIDTAQTIRQLLVDAHEHLSPGGDRTWRELGEATVPLPPPPTPQVLRGLRALNHPAALPCTNLVVHTRQAAQLAQRVFGELAVQLAVVTGEAGYGKTQLAAKLTSATDTRPAGVLLYGRRLSVRDDLNQLARQVIVAGKPVETFEALLAAVDAAAARAQCRLPIVIDGLNEAENPSDWAPLLQKLELTLAKYPSVLVVCTMRAAFVPRAIPPSVTCVVDLDGFTNDLDEVTQKYFDFFNIDPSGADLPRELLRQPLALRIFCSVANPTRENRVQLALLPRSLNEMFDEYLSEVARRIDQLHLRISADDVTGALEQLGVEMWTTGSREVDEKRARDLFGDVGRWDDSVLQALEHEGVLIRQPAQDAEAVPASSGPPPAQLSGGGLTVAVVYDLLAGHIVASAMVRSGGSAFTNSLRTPEVVNRFLSTSAEQHPLAVDIFDALAFVLPRSDMGHLWQFVEGKLRDAALLRTTALRAEIVDLGTVEAWSQALDSLMALPSFWPRLQMVRAVPEHPLNSVYLDGLLRVMSVADRDLRWTEWLRGNSHSTLIEVRAMTAHWRIHAERSKADALRARWFMWMLTSTVRDLRDAATAALYWYGRGNATELFSLAIDALAVNDQYVGERVVAAAYGVATAHQSHAPEFAPQFGAYLEELVSAVAGDAPTSPTFHRLTRYYIASTIEFARVHYPDVVPRIAADGIHFAPGALSEALLEGDERRQEVEPTIHMDFGNYTLGRLFEDRNNYDYDHEGHRAATDRVLGVVFDLGWRQKRFSAIDSSIARRGNDHGPGRTDRYGKKYGWIGFHLVSGMLSARGERVYWLEVDIDPTFPQPSPPLPLVMAEWARPTPKDDHRWLVDGEITVPDELLRCESLDGAAGPWVLVHAEISAKDAQTGRSCYGLFNTIAVEQCNFDSLLDWWLTVGHPGRDLIDLPKAYYLFAGEVPWHPRMVTSGDDIAGTGTRTIPQEPKVDGWVDPHELEDPYIDEIRVYNSCGDEENDGIDAVGHDIKEGNDAAGGSDDTESADEIGQLEAIIGGWRHKEPPYRSLAFESLTHSFAWEGHNSSENQEFAYVPSHRLSQQLGLQAVPAGFDQVDSSGKPAAKSFSAPAGFAGHLLYLREDLVKAFAAGRTVVTFGFGERQIQMAWPGEMPDHIREAYRNHRNVWRMQRMVIAASSYDPSTEALKANSASDRA